MNQHKPIATIATTIATAASEMINFLVIPVHLRFQGSVEPEDQEQKNQNQRRNPPNPMNPVWLRTAGAELLLDELVVIEIFFRYAKTVGMSRIRPASIFIGAAFRTGFGVAREDGTAVGANFRRHL